MYRIWARVYRDGKYVGAWVSERSYKYAGNAVRFARKRFGDNKLRVPAEGTYYEWKVKKEV